MSSNAKKQPALGRGLGALLQNSNTDITSTGTATGTHSAENFQQNQALFEQQALQNQAEDQEQQSDQSAVTWNENQEHVDWDGPIF